VDVRRVAGETPGQEMPMGGDAKRVLSGPHQRLGKPLAGCCMKDTRSLGARNSDHVPWHPNVPSSDVLIPTIRPTTRQEDGKKSSDAPWLPVWAHE